MFYPERRDGFARIGKIEIGSRRIATPYMIDYFNDKDTIEKIEFGKAPYVLKYIAEEVYERLRAENEELNVATGLSVLSPRQLVKAFSELRSSKPLYAVAAATPTNVSLLIYLGADIVDNILAIAKGYDGVYFLGDVEVKLENLKELPCSCKFCENANLEDLSNPFEVAAKHNTEVLRLEVEKCRMLIEREELRNYVEAKVKLNPELTAALRLADLESSTLFPRFRKSRCQFSAIESFNRFEVRYFLQRALECYEPKTDVLLLLPCTARKPYLLSKTHRVIRSRVRINVNEIIISSPLVVPREFELAYPACNYDTPVTGQWSDEEIAFVASWLRKFVEKGDFEKIVAHVEGGYRRVVERALSDYDVVFTADDGVLSERSINKLRKEIEGYGKYNLFAEIFDHMARYQFGLSFNGKVRGRYPNLELVDSERVARIDTVYGMLDIYAKAARKLIDENVYVVEIEDFEPTSTIFAAGVVGADERIRPNDVVVFYSQRIFGVGIAAMSGEEMVKSDRGIAVKVRRKMPLS